MYLKHFLLSKELEAGGKLNLLYHPKIKSVKDKLLHAFDIYFRIGLKTSSAHHRFKLVHCHFLITFCI